MPARDLGRNDKRFQETMGNGAIMIRSLPKREQQPSGTSSEPKGQSDSVPQEWVDQIFQEAREQMSGFRPECLEAYKRGDRIGLIFEGGSMFQPIDEAKLALALTSSQGSDESSIVDCFMNFIHNYTYSSRGQFVWDWVNFHEQNHGRGYGKTYRDHFALVKHLRKDQKNYPDLESRLAKLGEIAKDAGSFGNGSLALVYPAYFYAASVGEEPVDFVRYLTSFSHANPDAMEAVTLLCRFIENPALMDQYRPATEEELINRFVTSSSLTASNTLMIALYIAKGNSEMEVIRRGVYAKGDTDSTLSTAMLLWQLYKERK